MYMTHKIIIAIESKQAEERRVVDERCHHPVIDHHWSEYGIGKQHEASGVTGFHGYNG